MTDTKETTPPPTHIPDDIPHQAPSLPNSPLAKRPKIAAMAIPENPTASAPQLLVKKLIPEARAPTRGSALAAGYDLYAAKDIVLPAKGKGLVSTGLAIAVPEGTFKEGDRVAQLVLERIYTPEVLVVEQLEESVRGAGGFGSTG
ncbi:deoxyuridine 5'-triphosphate nucleotidohydrolase [Arthroderma uncinatum]|uniref:deoxyuridine 5'-triphosphate nucleotidohydrolase n=1 Tax=Arthroderma uncinatum TaxID=74035 RepID=UPI00144AB6D9|nr:deoxyuridine 5'-triphosphate nucleotidohydrolase [Arthroderma uncinatum]KAF3484144.1 deoxyuridine 5'-triphosphate nucleotidohydrolase [Arthroderma uncinatum]